MRTRTRRFILPCRKRIHVFLAGIVFSALLMGSSQVLMAAEPPVAIEISTRPITAFDIAHSSRRQFGSLQFRGGLVLRSTYRHFGGLSAIRVAPNGADFIALTDKGWWLRGRILYDGTRPSAIANAEMAPMLGPDGAPLAARGWYDTESIAQDGDTVYVGIERVHQIVRFNYGKDGLLARGYPIALPRAVRSLPSNKGLEALVFIPQGLRGGDLLLLERKFNWTDGLGVRMRRIALAEVRAGALVDGAVLLEADLGHEIDNMEGLSVHRGAGGETVLTLVSDDNFSIIQRTLLLQFALSER